MVKVIIGFAVLILVLVALFFAAAWYLRWARERDLRVPVPPTTRRQPDRFTNPDADATAREIDGAMSVWEHNAR